MANEATFNAGKAHQMKCSESGCRYAAKDGGKSQAGQVSRSQAGLPSCRRVATLCRVHLTPDGRPVRAEYRGGATWRRRVVFTHPDLRHEVHNHGAWSALALRTTSCGVC